jgi:hypothetical protein
VTNAAKPWESSPFIAFEAAARQKFHTAGFE